ncbi:LacI family transcriptional regulator [Chloroflexia bacterium SDU3-3]|nr:LacI family transcriptional regulator [Chloroflexia bacterium SDU3-3]
MRKRRATSQDVAKRAGVSRSTVSAILNHTPGIGYSEETRKSVLQAIQELNYKVNVQAKSMRTGLSRCIAVYGNVTNPLFLQSLDGIQEVCSNNDYHLLLYGAKRDPAYRFSMIDVFLQHRIDGIISVDYTTFQDFSWFKTISTEEVPYVSIEGYPTNSDVSSVLMDYAHSVTIALEYMSQRSPVLPLYLELYDTADGHSYENWAETNRRNAYCRWMKSHGSEPRVLSIEDQPWAAGSHFWISWLSQQQLPMTVLSNWSRGAAYLYRAAYSLGLRIGRDLQVMACDNTERINAHMIPTLSAVEVPYKDMGILATKRLIEYISHRRPTTDTSSQWLSARLVPGESI